jgi:hypothetical protein
MPTLLPATQTAADHAVKALGVLHLPIKNFSASSNPMEIKEGIDLHLDV